MLTTAAIGFFIYALFNGFFFRGLILSAIVFIVGFGLLGQSQILAERNKEKQKERLLSLDTGPADLENYPSLVSNDVLKRITLHPEQQQMYIWLGVNNSGKLLQKPKNGMSYRLLTYSFSELLSVAIVEDRSIILLSSKSREDAALQTYIQERPVGDKAVNVNAVREDKVRSLALILHIADEQIPFYQFDFYNEPHTDLAKRSTEYQVFLDEMHTWYEMLKICINPVTPNLSDSIAKVAAGLPAKERQREADKDKGQQTTVRDKPVLTTQDALEIPKSEVPTKLVVEKEQARKTDIRKDTVRITAGVSQDASVTEVPSRSNVDQKPLSQKMDMPEQAKPLSTGVTEDIPISKTMSTSISEKEQTKQKMDLPEQAKPLSTGVMEDIPKRQTTSTLISEKEQTKQKMDMPEKPVRITIGSSQDSLMTEGQSNHTVEEPTEQKVALPDETVLETVSKGESQSVSSSTPSAVEKEEKKELSYFERIVAENRRQLKERQTKRNE
ncbi:hypothetical protein HNO89_002137 [Sporosarcina luteola]|nr:hypothetical protein [Sporosarcina luteola]